MSRSEMMRKKRNSNAVDLMRLLKKIDCFVSSLICVFEGDDSKYYGSRIDSYFSEMNRKNLTCKGKKNVLDLKETIEANSELINAKILFFVDSDFEEKQSYFNLYSTPCYAIENLYVSTQVFSRILMDELGLCSFKDKEIISVLVDKYKAFESNSDEALSELNAWLIVRIREAEVNKNIKLNLNNVSVDKFLNVAALSSTKCYTLDDLDTIFSIETAINPDDLESALHVIRESNKARYCRGKYRLEYFRAFLNDLFSESRNGEGNFSDRKIKPKLSLVKANIISELSQYAETPDCLKEFLDHYKSIIAA